MKSIKIVGVSTVVAFAMSAMLVSSASALRVVLRDSAGVIPAGTLITAESTNLVTVTAAGNLECEHSVLPATLTNNTATKVLSKSTESLEFGNYLGIPGACKTSSAGPATIETKDFPWSEEYKYSALKKIGQVIVKGNLLTGTKKIEFMTTFLGLSPPNKCLFFASKLLSTFAPGAAGKPLPLEFTTPNQVFKLNKKAPGTSAICPPEGKLSGAWSSTDANGAVSAEVIK